jgi:hypothetical protein
LAVVVYNKFNKKELFSFSLQPGKPYSITLRARIYETAVRHDIVAIACGSFSFIVKIDPTAKNTQNPSCIIS